MLASDVANPEFAGAKNPDAALIVEFYMRPVQNNVESTAQGRPIYEDICYVRINVPGVKESQWDMPARSDHKQKFPLHWQHFINKTQGDAREIGTPLAEWPILTRSQAEEFRAIKFFTVESIANAGDANLNNLGMIGGMSPYALRDKARAFLAAATNSALPQKQAEELAKRDQEIALLKEQFAQLAAQVGKPAAPAVAPAPVEVVTVLSPPAKKRGRPSKADIAARKAASG